MTGLGNGNGPSAPVEDVMAQPAGAESPLSSVHTQSLTKILTQAGISLAVTTYQAGKLIVARADGDIVNTHFRSLRKPMGMVASAGRLCVGTQNQIIDFRNVPAVAARLPPEGKHTACYLPRASYITGDIDIHEMADISGDLYFINTRFSCLCRLNSDFSFEPIWKPDFISAYDIRDRCHLNGLGIRDGELRYVTALAATDEPGGWRQHKADGGLIIDIVSNKTVVSGLSMPHSPRWYDGRLWVLESGNGTLVSFNAETGARDFECQLPGFTRGLDFYKNLAFVGVSKVRETAVFSGLKVTSEQAVRDCGVWVIDLITSKIVGFLKFTGGVEEVFAVSVLPHSYPDVINDNEQLIRASYVIPDACLQQAASLDTGWQNTESIFEEGNQLYNQGRYEAAGQKYEKVLELDSNYLPARYRLGLSYFSCEKLKEAKDTMLMVIQKEAAHFEAMNSLGVIYSRLGDLQSAKKYFLSALEINPRFSGAQENLKALEKNTDFSGL